MLANVMTYILRDQSLGPLLRAEAGFRNPVPHIDLDYEERRAVVHAPYLRRFEFQFSVWTDLTALGLGENIADELDALLARLRSDDCPGLIYWDIKSRQSGAEKGYWRVQSQYIALAVKSGGQIPSEAASSPATQSLVVEDASRPPAHDSQNVPGDETPTDKATERGRS